MQGWGGVLFSTVRKMAQAGLVVYSVCWSCVSLHLCGTCWVPLSPCWSLQTPPATRHKINSRNKPNTVATLWGEIPTKHPKVRKCPVSSSWEGKKVLFDRYQGSEVSTQYSNDDSSWSLCCYLYCLHIYIYIHCTELTGALNWHQYKWSICDSNFWWKIHWRL